MPLSELPTCDGDRELEEAPERGDLEAPTDRERRELADPAVVELRLLRPLVVITDGSSPLFGRIGTLATCFGASGGLLSVSG